MLTTETMIAFSIIYLVDSITPGPAVSTVIVRGATIGIVRTLPFIAGLIVGDLLLFALAAAGLIALAAALGPLFFVIKWVGVAYLLYFAYQLWNAKFVETQEHFETGEGLRLFGMATLLPLGNPRAVGFYIALLPVVMDISLLTPTTYFQLSGIIVIIWGGCLCSYGFAASRASRIFKKPIAQRILNRCASCSMVGVAGTIAARN